MRKMTIELFPVKDVEKFETFLKKCFPENELRSHKDFVRLFANPAYHVWSYRDQDHMQAVLSGFVFDDYVFFEFLAVDASLRGQGMGQRILTTAIKKLGKPVILEVEPPHDRNSERRIGFYERLGFKLNHFPYRMPKLDGEHGDIPLLLMSYPEAISEANSRPLIQHISQNVYEKALD